MLSNLLTVLTDFRLEEREQQTSILKYEAKFVSLKELPKFEKMSVIYFDNYKQHPGTTVNPSLLWEYDLAHFDYLQMRNIVVQRVVERGWRNDWYAALNLYGIEGMKNAIKELPYLNDKDMHFVSLIFEIPLSEMKCYEKKQSQQAHWNS